MIRLPRHSLRLVPPGVIALLLPACVGDLNFDFELPEGPPNLKVAVDGQGGILVDACADDVRFCVQHGKFTAQAAGETTTLDVESGFSQGRLAADAPGTEVVVEWRDGGQRLGGWRVTIPEAFTISAPVSGATIIGGPEVTVAWSPAGTRDRMSISEVRLCDRVGGDAVVWAVHGIDGDPGATTYREIGAAVGPGELCKIGLELRRTRVGTADPDTTVDGRLEATQTRGVSFEVVGPPPA